MTLVRWLCISLLALTVPGALHAQTVSFTTLGLTTLFGQESQVPLAGEPGCTTSIWSTLWTPEGPFAPVCVQECLKAWRECWDRGDYEDACCHASKAILLDPKHREAQRVHELTRKIINSLARFDAEWNTTF